MDRYEDFYQELVQDIVRQSIREQNRGNIERTLDRGAQFEPRSSGVYGVGGYRRGWRFGMKMESENFAR
jgi:hypothetical protein